MPYSRFKRFSVLSLILCSHSYGAVSPLCNRYSKQSEHYKTCAKYEATNVKELTPNAVLSEEVDNASAGQLLIVPATPFDDSAHRLSAPIKLKPRMGLLAASEGVDGFFNLGWQPDFNIGTDPVYCLILMNDDTNITGVRIDANTMTSINTLHFNQSRASLKTLIYATGDSSINLSWSSLTGRQGMNGNLWVNADQSDNNTTFRVNTNWIDTDGAKHGLYLSGNKTTDDLKAAQMDVQNNVVILNNLDSDTDKQVGLHTRYTGGHSRQNTYVFRDDDLFLSTQRTAQVLEDSNSLKVSQNFMISEVPKHRSSDSAYEFIESSQRALRALLFGDILSDKIETATVDASGLGILLQGMSRDSSSSFNLTETGFFSNPLAQAGNCQVPRYILSNPTGGSGMLVDSEQPSCGMRLTREDFDLPMEYTNASSSQPGSNDNSYLTAIVFSWTITGAVISLNMIYGVYQCVYKPWSIARKAASGDSAELVSADNLHLDSLRYLRHGGISFRLFYN